MAAQPGETWTDDYGSLDGSPEGLERSFDGVVPGQGGRHRLKMGGDDSSSLFSESPQNLWLRHPSSSQTLTPEHLNALQQALQIPLPSSRQGSFSAWLSDIPHVTSFELPNKSIDTEEWESMTIEEKTAWFDENVVDPKRKRRAPGSVVSDSPVSPVNMPKLFLRKTNSFSDRPPEWVYQDNEEIVRRPRMAQETYPMESQLPVASVAPLASQPSIGEGLDLLGNTYSIVPSNEGSFFSVKTASSPRSDDSETTAGSAESARLRFQDPKRSRSFSAVSSKGWSDEPPQSQSQEPVNPKQAWGYNSQDIDNFGAINRRISDSHNSANSQPTGRDVNLNFAPQLRALIKNDT